MNCNLSIVSTTLICAAAERYEHERDCGPVAAPPAAAVQLPPLAPGHRGHPLHPPHPPRHPRQPPPAHHAPQVTHSDHCFIFVRKCSRSLLGVKCLDMGTS